MTKKVPKLRRSVVWSTYSAREDRQRKGTSNVLETDTYTKVKGKPFRNEETYEALKLAADSLHEYDESIEKFGLEYENGEEISLDKINCVSLISSFKLISVLVFVKTSGFSRGIPF